MKETTEYKKYFKKFLRVAPFALAFWRTSEAVAFSSVQYKKPILDLGCGFGEFAGVVFNKMEMGIDINEEELAQAFRGGKYKKVLWADARELPFKNSSYSTVLSVSVLEHIKEADYAIREVHRILKKDGLLIFTVPTDKLYENLAVVRFLILMRLEWLAKIYFYLHSKAFDHVCLKSDVWWDKQLKKAGFKIIKKHGTVSPKATIIYDFFLLPSFPSQIWKMLFGRRLALSFGLRSKIFPKLFLKYTKIDDDSPINIFYVAKKV